MDIQMHDHEWIVEWEDGSEWAISWFKDGGAFFAQRSFFDERWFFDEEDEDYLDCPGPDLGLFDSLDTLELAMGRPLPADIRQELLSHSEAHPISEDSLRAWGGIVAYEVHRVAPDGEIVPTFAPPGTADPFAIEWLPEWM